nr:allantoate deiminase [Ipomoea batatas]
MSLSIGSENEVGTKYDLFPQILKEEAVSRLYELGKVSDADNYLERTFQSPASVRAGNRIRSWMEDAGLRTWIDQMGNVHGRVEGINPSGKALLIGSHLDTVIDAGYFDGALGIITAISALKVLKTTGRLEKLSKPVEVIAFSDEEGVRFQSTFLGSAAIAGTLPVTTLHIHDKGGVTVQSALRKNSLDITEENLLKLKYDQESVSDYIEVHIEQGPVLENLGLPLGLVKGIAGQTRLKVTVRGTQGHAGTVPMAMRQDPMVASAELIVLLENLCKQPEYYLSYDDECPTSTVKSLAGSLVCTVGEISTWPSASNVIPGQASFLACLDMMQMQCRASVEESLASRAYKIKIKILVKEKGERDDYKCVRKTNANDFVAEIWSELSLALHFSLGRSGVDQRGLLCIYAKTQTVRKTPFWRTSDAPPRHQPSVLDCLTYQFYGLSLKFVDLLIGQFKGPEKGRTGTGIAAKGEWVCCY